MEDFQLLHPILDLHEYFQTQKRFLEILTPNEKMSYFWKFRSHLKTISSYSFFAMIFHHYIDYL